MLSGRSESGTCLPAGVIVQPFGSRKPFSVGPAKRGLGGWGLSSAEANRVARRTTRRVAAGRSITAVSGGPTGGRKRRRSRASGGTSIVTAPEEASSVFFVKASAVVGHERGDDVPAVLAVD